ncbi:hypothetical protein ACFO4E_25495 [Nocardiopsis mangrovi]|uniref:Chaplin domain-containing protein n=1 Tax=Nocardiopsis mangrovi TaxID=1179818 RepID=A0ABV9E5I4_9ACTN
MLRKLGAAGLIAGAALSAVVLAAPAHASGGHHDGDQQYNQNLQAIPVSVCNANVGVLAITVPVLSPQTTGDCVNGPISTNLDD